MMVDIVQGKPWNVFGCYLSTRVIFWLIERIAEEDKNRSLDVDAKKRKHCVLMFATGVAICGIATWIILDQRIHGLTNGAKFVIKTGAVPTDDVGFGDVLLDGHLVVVTREEEMPGSRCRLACNKNMNVMVDDRTRVRFSPQESVSPSVIRRMICHMERQGELQMLVDMDSAQFMSTYNEFCRPQRSEENMYAG